MANVEIAAVTGGICQYCAEKPASRLINGEWRACRQCAARVASGAEDLGYEAYCAVTELHSNGIYWCHVCEREVGACACACIDEEIYEAHANDLPLVPPAWPTKILRQQERKMGRLRAMRQAFRDRPSPGGRGAVAFWLDLAAYYRKQDPAEWQFAMDQARAQLTTLRGPTAWGQAPLSPW